MPSCIANEFYDWPSCEDNFNIGNYFNETEYWACGSPFPGSCNFMACYGYNNVFDNPDQCYNSLEFSNNYSPCPCNGFYQTDGFETDNYPMWAWENQNQQIVGSGYCCQYYENSGDAQPSSCGAPIPGAEGACSCVNGPQGDMCNTYEPVGWNWTPGSEHEGGQGGLVSIQQLNPLAEPGDCYCDPDCLSRGDCCMTVACDGDANCERVPMRNLECVTIDTPGCTDDTADNFDNQPACGNEGFCDSNAPINPLGPCNPSGDDCGGSVCYPGCPDGCYNNCDPYDDPDCTDRCPLDHLPQMCDYHGCTFYCLREDNQFWCQGEEAPFQYPYGDNEVPWPDGVPCPCPGENVIYQDLIAEGFTVFWAQDSPELECVGCPYDTICDVHNVSTCDPVFNESHRYYTDSDNDGIGCCSESGYFCESPPVNFVTQECEESGDACMCDGEYDNCNICNGTNQCSGCLDPNACNYNAMKTNDCSANGDGTYSYDFGGGGFEYYLDILVTMFTDLNMWLYGCGPVGLNEWAISDPAEDWCTESPCDCENPEDFGYTESMFQFGWTVHNKYGCTTCVGDEYFACTHWFDVSGYYSLSDSQINQICEILVRDTDVINHETLNVFGERKRDYWTIQGELDTCGADFGGTNPYCNGLWLGIYGDTTCCEYPGTEPYQCDCSGAQPVTYYNDTNDYDGDGCGTLSNEWCPGEQPTGWVETGTGSCEECPSTCDEEGGGVGSGSSSCEDHCGVCFGNSYCVDGGTMVSGQCDISGGGYFYGNHFDCEGVCHGETQYDLCGVCGGSNWINTDNCCENTEDPTACKNKVIITYPDHIQYDNAILSPGDFITVKVHIYRPDDPIEYIKTWIEPLPGEDFGWCTVPFKDYNVQYIGDNLYQVIHNYYVSNDGFVGPSGLPTSDFMHGTPNGTANPYQWQNTKFRVGVEAKEAIYECESGNYYGNDSSCTLPDYTQCTPCNNVGDDVEIETQTTWNQSYNWWIGPSNQYVGCGNYQYTVNDQNYCLEGICTNGTPCFNPGYLDEGVCGTGQYCNPGPCWDGADCTIGYASFLITTWEEDTESFIVDAGPNFEVNSGEEFAININHIYQGNSYNENTFQYVWNQISGNYISNSEVGGTCGQNPEDDPSCRWFLAGGSSDVADFELKILDGDGNELGSTTLRVTVVSPGRSSALESRNINIKSKKKNYIDSKKRSHDIEVPVRKSPPIKPLNPNYSGLYGCILANPNGIFGDVDGSGSVTVLDIVKVIQNMDDLSVLGECAPYFADMNRDGVVDMTDIMSMVQVILNRWDSNLPPINEDYQQTRNRPDQFLGCPSKYPHILNDGEPHINHDWDCWEDGMPTSCDGCYPMYAVGWPYVCQDDINGSMFTNDPTCGGNDCACIIKPNYVCKKDPEGDTSYPSGDMTCDTDGSRNPQCNVTTDVPVTALWCMYNDGSGHIETGDADCSSPGDECGWTIGGCTGTELSCVGWDDYSYECTAPGDTCGFIFQCAEVEGDPVDCFVGTCSIEETGEVDSTTYECTSQCLSFGTDASCGGQCEGEGNYCVDKLEYCCLENFPTKWTDKFQSKLEDWNGLPDDYQMKFLLKRCDDDSLSSCTNVGDYGPERDWADRNCADVINMEDCLFGHPDFINTSITKSPYDIPIVSVFGSDCIDGDRLTSCSRCTGDNDCDIRGMLPRFESLPPLPHSLDQYVHVGVPDAHNKRVFDLQEMSGNLFAGLLCSSGPYEGQKCEQHYGTAGENGCGNETHHPNQTVDCEAQGSCEYSCLINPLTQGPPTIYQKLVRGTHYSYTGEGEPSLITNPLLPYQLYWDNTTFPAPYPTWDESSSLHENVPFDVTSNNPYPIVYNDGETDSVDVSPVYSLPIKNLFSFGEEKIYLKLYDPVYEEEYPLGCMTAQSGADYGLLSGVNEIKYHIYSEENICGGSHHDGLYRGVCSHDSSINCENNIDCRIKVSVVTNGGDAILSPSNCFKHGCTDGPLAQHYEEAGYPHHNPSYAACNYDAEAEVDDGTCIYQTKWYHDNDVDGLTNCSSAYSIQCEQPDNYYQCDCCDVGDCSSDDVCDDPNDYCQSNVIDECGICDGPNWCDGTMSLNDDTGEYYCNCDSVGYWPCWTSENDISSCSDGTFGFDCRGVCSNSGMGGDGWIIDPCGIGGTQNTTEYSISAGFWNNCVQCMDRDGDGDGLDYNKIACLPDNDVDGFPCDPDLSDSTCVVSYQCPGYNQIYFDSGELECPCPDDSDGTNCYQRSDGTYAYDANDNCEFGFWDNCGHCSSQEANISLYSDCRDDVECFDDQNGHKTDDCGNCMTMTCCDLTIDGSCPVGTHTPSFDGDGWRIANGNYIFNNPCAGIWGDNYVPGNLDWNVGCVDCAGLYEGDSIGDTTGICESAEDSGIFCPSIAHCCLPAATDACGVCLGTIDHPDTEYIFFKDWDRDGLGWADVHDFVCVKSNTIGGAPVDGNDGNYVVHGQTPIGIYPTQGLDGGEIDLIRWESCSSVSYEEDVGWSCYDDELPECPSNVIDCLGVCDGDAVEDECGVCGGDGYTEYWVDLGNLGVGYGTPLQHCTSTDGEPDVAWLGGCMNNSSWTDISNTGGDTMSVCNNSFADNYICNLYPCLSLCAGPYIQGSTITVTDDETQCGFLNLLLPNSVELSGYEFNVQINGGVSGDTPCDGTEFEGSTCWNNIDPSGAHSIYGNYGRLKIYELTESGGSIINSPIVDNQIDIQSTSVHSQNTEFNCDCGDGDMECECYQVGKYYKTIVMYPDPDISSGIPNCNENDSTGCVGYASKEFLFEGTETGCTDDGSLPSCETVCDLTNNICIGGPCINWNDPDGSLNDGVFTGDETCSTYTEGQSCQSTFDCQSYADQIHYQNCFPNRPATRGNTLEPYGSDPACDYNASVNVQSSCNYKIWMCPDSDNDGYGCDDEDLRQWLCSPQDGLIDCSTYTESGFACSCSAESSIIDNDPNHRVMWGSFELGMECFGYVNGDWLDHGDFGYDEDTIPMSIHENSGGQCVTGPDAGEDITYGDGSDLYNLCPSEINPVSAQPYIIGETIPGYQDECGICMDPMCAPAGLGSSKVMYDVANINPNNFIDLYIYGYNGEIWSQDGTNNPCESNHGYAGLVPTNPNWNKSCTGCMMPGAENYNPSAIRPCTGAATLDADYPSLNGNLTEFHDNPNPTCPGRCEYNPTRKCTSDDECVWSSPCDTSIENVDYGTCKYAPFTYGPTPGDIPEGLPVFEEYLNIEINPQGPNCCCEYLANTCPDECSPDYESGTNVDCLGNELKNCLFGFNSNNNPENTMYSGLLVTLDGGDTYGEYSFVDDNWSQEWPLFVKEGDYLRVGQEVVEVNQIVTMWPLSNQVFLSVTRGLFGTDPNVSHHNEKGYLEHTGYCNYQCCQDYEVEACMDPDAINYYCWGSYGYLINDYKICPEYSKIPNCNLETYYDADGNDICEMAIDSTSNDNWERRKVKPCNGDNSCCYYQHDCCGNVCNGRECDKRTNNCWFDFCGNCISPGEASTEGWANIGCGCNTTLGSEGPTPPVWYLDSDMDGFACANLPIQANVAGELTNLYQHYGLQIGYCLSNPSKPCFGLTDHYHTYGECGTGGGSAEDCVELTGGVYNCDDGFGGFIDGSDCAGFNWGWEYCDQPPRWYIKEDTVMGHSGTVSDLWWYDLLEDGLECTTDEDCQVTDPALWECWITQGDGCDLVPVQEGICDLSSNRCQHPGYQNRHETIPMCTCWSNDYDCFGECVLPEDDNPARFDSCSECSGTSLGCSKSVCKYEGMNICWDEQGRNPDTETFIGNGFECQDHCCIDDNCNADFTSYWIYRGERTVQTCLDKLLNSDYEIITNDTCTWQTGDTQAGECVAIGGSCYSDSDCVDDLHTHLWLYSNAAQRDANDTAFMTKLPDSEPGAFNQAFWCDFYHPIYAPAGNPYSQYDCNCDCNGGAYLDDCGVCVNIDGHPEIIPNSIGECKVAAGCEEYDPENGLYCELNHHDNPAYGRPSYSSKGGEGTGWYNWVQDGLGPDLDCNCDCMSGTLKHKYTSGLVEGVPEDQIIPWYGKAWIDFPMGDDLGMGSHNIVVDNAYQCASLTTQPDLCDQKTCGCVGGNVLPRYRRIMERVDTTGDGEEDTIYNPEGMGHDFCFTCFDVKATFGYDPQKHYFCSQWGGDENCHNATPTNFYCENTLQEASPCPCDPLMLDWQIEEATAGCTDSCGNCIQMISPKAAPKACQFYGCRDRYSLNYDPLSWGGKACIDSWIWNRGNDTYHYPVNIYNSTTPEQGMPWRHIDINQTEWSEADGVMDHNEMVQSGNFIIGEPSLEVLDTGDRVWVGDGCDGCTTNLGGVIKGKDWACDPYQVPGGWIYFDDLIENQDNWEWWAENIDLFTMAGLRYIRVQSDQTWDYQTLNGVFYGETNTEEWEGYCGSGGDGSLTEEECKAEYPNFATGGTSSCGPMYDFAEIDGRCIECDGWYYSIGECSDGYNVGERCYNPGGLDEQYCGGTCGDGYDEPCPCEPLDELPVCDEESCESIYGCSWQQPYEKCERSGTCSWRMPFLGWGQNCHIYQGDGKIGMRGVAALSTVQSCYSLTGLESAHGDWDTWYDAEVYHWHSMVIGGGSMMQDSYIGAPGESQFPNLPDAMNKTSIKTRYMDFVFRMEIPEAIMRQGMGSSQDPNITDIIVTYGDTAAFQLEPDMYAGWNNGWWNVCNPSDNSISVRWNLVNAHQNFDDIIEKMVTNGPFTVRAGYEGGSIVLSDEDNTQIPAYSVSICGNMQQTFDQGITNAMISVRKENHKPQVDCIVHPNNMSGLSVFSGLDHSYCQFNEGRSWYDGYGDRRGVCLRPDSGAISNAHGGYALAGICDAYLWQDNTDEYGESCDSCDDSNCSPRTDKGQGYCEAVSTWDGTGTQVGPGDCKCRCQYNHHTPYRFVDDSSRSDCDCSVGSWGFGNSDAGTGGRKMGWGQVGPHKFGSAEYIDDYIWFDNFRLQSARKSGMLGMIEINRWHTHNKSFGRSRYDYCCLPSWCGGWDGDWCEDCYCEDMHSLYDNSWEISFIDDSHQDSCGLTFGNPSILNLDGACAESTSDEGVIVSGNGEITEIPTTALTNFKEAHRKNVLWRYTDKGSTKANSCGGTGGSSGQNVGYVQNYQWQPGEWVENDRQCDKTPGTYYGGNEKYGIVAGEYGQPCGKPTTFKLHEFPNMKDPCYNKDACSGGELLADGDAGIGTGDGWCQITEDGGSTYENCFSSQACTGTCTDSPYKRWMNISDDNHRPDNLGADEANDWEQITRRWDTEDEFLAQWNQSNFVAAKQVLDDYWDDDGYYYFVTKATGTQGFYTDVDGGDIYDWFVSQTNYLNDCGLWCFGGWRRPDAWSIYPLSKKLIKEAWMSEDPQPYLIIWGNKGGKSNEEVCNNVYLGTDNPVENTKVKCHIFDIPVQKPDGGGYATDCGSDSWYEGSTNHTWRTFPTNWSPSTGEGSEVWQHDRGDDSFWIAFSVTIWPPSFVHSKGNDWNLLPFGPDEVPEGDGDGDGNAVTYGGCMDDTADNYNPLSTYDDGSCSYPEPVLGCTNPSAHNYDSAANVENDSCVFTSNEPVVRHIRYRPAIGDQPSFCSICGTTGNYYENPQMSHPKDAFGVNMVEAWTNYPYFPNKKEDWPTTADSPQECCRLMDNNEKELTDYYASPYEACNGCKRNYYPYRDDNTYYGAPDCPLWDSDCSEHDIWEHYGLDGTGFMDCLWLDHWELSGGCNKYGHCTEICYGGCWEETDWTCDYMTGEDTLCGNLSHLDHIPSNWFCGNNTCAQAPGAEWPGGCGTASYRCRDFILETKGYSCEIVGGNNLDYQVD